MTDRYDKLEQLRELNANGTLTDDEYEREKEKILHSRDEPETTVIHTRERSSFASVLFGGLFLFAILALIYWLFTSFSDDPEAAAPGAPAAQEQPGARLELDIPSLDEGGGEPPAREPEPEPEAPPEE